MDEFSLFICWVRKHCPMQVHELLPGRASIVHQKYLAMMEKECGYGLGKVPQLEDVSNFLKSEMKFIQDGYIEIGR